MTAQFKNIAPADRFSSTTRCDADCFFIRLKQEIIVLLLSKLRVLFDLFT